MLCDVCRSPKRVQAELNAVKNVNMSGSVAASVRCVCVFVCAYMRACVGGVWVVGLGLVGCILELCCSVAAIT